MKIATFIKQSLIDWHGKIAATVFTQGCNFNCSYCHNQLLIPYHSSIHSNLTVESDFFDYLNQRKNWIDGVVISGGEPTIQPDLINFASKIKGIGYPIKLDTNGSNPNILQELITSKLIDYVAMDVKTIIDFTNYEELVQSNDAKLISKIEHSIDTILNSQIEYEFRTTIVPYHHNQQMINNIKEMFANRNLKFQEYRCPDKYSR